MFPATICLTFPPLFLTCDDGKIIVYLKLLIDQH